MLGPVPDRVVPTRWMVLLLAATIWVVFSPGLNRVFATEQLWYFAELEGDTSLGAGLRHYDYAATRQYWKGDDALFRPLLFVWLAMSATLLTYHHIWWNLVGLTLHLVAGVAFYRCLLAIQPSRAAAPFTLLFVVSLASIELVLWNHLGGYLVAWILFLIGLRALVLLTRDHEGPPSVGTAAYVVPMTAACFLHEVMVPVALLGGVLLVRHQREKGRGVPALAMVLWMMPVLLFAFFYGLHLLRVERPAYVDARPGGLFVLRSVALLLPKAVMAAGRWTIDVVLPAAVELRAAPFELYVKGLALEGRAAGVAVNAALLVAAGVLFLRLGAWQPLRRRAPVAVLLVGTLLAYAFVLAIGRQLSDMVGVAYYLYPVNLVVLLLAYTALDASRLRGRTAWAAALVLAGVVAINAVGTRTAAVALGAANGPASDYLARVAAFVDARKGPDFKFHVINASGSVDPLVPLRLGYPDARPEPVTERRTTEILFRPYYSESPEAEVLDARGLMER